MKMSKIIDTLTGYELTSKKQLIIALIRSDRRCWHYKSDEKYPDEHHRFELDLYAIYSKLSVNDIRLLIYLRNTGGIATGENITV